MCIAISLVKYRYVLDVWATNSDYRYNQNIVIARKSVRYHYSQYRYRQVGLYLYLEWGVPQPPLLPLVKSAKPAQLTRIVHSILAKNPLSCPILFIRPHSQHTFVGVTSLGPLRQASLCRVRERERERERARSSRRGTKVEMNQAMVSAAWPHEDPRDPMISAAVDDFTTFLDLVDFPVSFPPSLDPVSTVGNDEVVESMDLGPDGSRAMAGSVDASLSRRQQQQTMAHASHSIDAPLEFDLQPHLVQHQQRQSMPEQPYHPPYMIPPTPNSIEMQGGAARYYQHTDAQAQALYYQQMKDDQVLPSTWTE